MGDPIEYPRFKFVSEYKFHGFVKHLLGISLYVAGMDGSLRVLEDTCRNVDDMYWKFAELKYGLHKLTGYSRNVTRCWRSV